MTFDFDTEIDRRHTGSIKWSIIQDKDDPTQWIKTDAYYGENRVLPLWVADMDLACPEVIQNALAERARHPIYGYTAPDDAYLQVVTGWMKRRHGWEVDPEWVVCTPGVVPALHLAVRAFSSPGGKVLVQRPVYYPFFSAIETNDREIVSNSLDLENGRYRMDLDDLEKKAADPNLHLAILCSPHNPVGRVWDPDELEAFARICLDNDVIIVSDEIHGDLTYPGCRFTPLATLGETFADQSITCTAPSKTFNLAGLQTSNIIIRNAGIREAFTQAMKAAGMFGLNAFGMTACRAGYERGEPWLEELRTYLAGNLAAMTDFFKTRLPQISVIEPQGTYLVWFDCRALGLDHLELRRLMLEKARVFLDEGYIFGPEGRGFERINIACPRPMLMEALERIAAAVESL